MFKRIKDYISRKRRAKYNACLTRECREKGLPLNDINSMYPTIMMCDRMCRDCNSFTYYDARRGIFECTNMYSKRLFPKYHEKACELFAPRIR